MSDLTSKLILTTSDANIKLAEVKQEAESTQSVVEKPVAVKISAEHALATIRDVKIAVDGVNSAVSELVNSMNGLLDASLVQRQAMTLPTIAFGDAAYEMRQRCHQGLIGFVARKHGNAGLCMLYNVWLRNIQNTSKRWQQDQRRS